MEQKQISYLAKNLMTEQAKKYIERRKHQRYHPDRKNQPRVHFMLNDGDKFSVDVVNISQGGLLGYALNKEFFSNNNKFKKIEDIEIAFPGRNAFHCSGKLLRVQPSREKQKIFCAIQFDDMGHDENHKLLNVGERIEQSFHPIKEIVIPDQSLVDRVSKAENYLRINDPRLSSEIRKNVYDSFDDITHRLSREEKWWFFEMLDEMKRREPEYPENLKQAFIKLCHTGIEQILKKKKGRR